MDRKTPVYLMEFKVPGTGQRVQTVAKGKKEYKKLRAAGWRTVREIFDPIDKVVYVAYYKQTTEQIYAYYKIVASFDGRFMRVRIGYWAQEWVLDTHTRRVLSWEPDARSSTNHDLWLTLRELFPWIDEHIDKLDYKLVPADLARYVREQRRKARQRAMERLYRILTRRFRRVDESWLKEELGLSVIEDRYYRWRRDRSEIMRPFDAAIYVEGPDGRGLYKVLVGDISENNIWVARLYLAGHGFAYELLPTYYLAHIETCYRRLLGLSEDHVLIKEV